jgi:hypothetical protein
LTGKLACLVVELQSLKTTQFLPTVCACSQNLAEAGSFYGG